MIQDKIRYIKYSLDGYYPPTEIDSLIEIIITDFLKFKKVDIYMGKDINLSETQEVTLTNILERLRSYEPIQYILGFADFYKYRYTVAPGVLIPRPETEELVDIIVNENKDIPLKILDIGTGSGCIAISLALSIAGAEVTAWDISADALEIAKENSRRLDSKVCFEQKDVLAYVPDQPRFDVIVSNPPYVLEKEKQQMESNVLNWEPFDALFVPDNDPLLFYRKIADIGLSLLLPGGRIYYEINAALGQEIKEMLEAMGYSNCHVLKDMFGRDRFIKVCYERVIGK